MDRLASIFVPGQRVARAHTASGPLAGVSFAAKDSFDIEGHSASAGHPRWAETHGPARADAQVIACLRSLGADLVGVTIMDELAFSLTGQNAHYGTPDNPRAPGRLCGGSSAGSAAAVAGELCGFALGTDTSGSIRVPASLCGLYGLRPTHGRVSSQGVVPLAPSFDCVGWLTRDGAMLTRVSEALLGEPTPAVTTTPTRLLVADDAFAWVQADVRALMLHSLTSLCERLGLACEHVSLAEGQLESWAALSRRTQGREAWAALGGWLERAKPELSQGVAERFELARTLATTASTDDLASDAALRAEVRARLEHVTSAALLVLPPAVDIAPRRDASRRELDSFRARTIPVVCPSGLSGLPQVVVPAGEHQAAPLGLSFLGPRGSDLALVSFARQVGDALG